MTKHALSFVALALAGTFLTAACGSDEPAQDPSQVQPYPQPTYTAPPQPAPAPMNPAGALALPCQSDGGICTTHKCNLQTQKCAFPCANTATDCMAGTNCMAGVCIPGAPQ